MHARCVTSWSGFASPNGASTSVGSSAASAGDERVDEHVGRDRSVAGVVGVLDEVEVHRRRVEQRRARRASSCAAHLHHVVAGREARSARPTCASGRRDTRAGCPANTVTTVDAGMRGHEVARSRAPRRRGAATRSRPDRARPAAAGPTPRIGTSSSSDASVRLSHVACSLRVDALRLLVDRAELAVAARRRPAGSRGSGVNVSTMSHAAGEVVDRRPPERERGERAPRRARWRGSGARPGGSRGRARRP